MMPTAPYIYDSPTVSSTQIPCPQVVVGDWENQFDLSVIIPALDEALNLTILLPQLSAVLNRLEICSEVLIIIPRPDPQTIDVGNQNGARVLIQQERGYGGALITGFEAARGDYLLTMDADLSHAPDFIADLWQCRQAADVTIASRYTEGGKAKMPLMRYLLSRILNLVFSRGLSLTVRDMSSGFRLYKARVVQRQPLHKRDFDILQEILARALAEGWKVQEVPFHYSPRRHGHSHARILHFGMAYLKTFGELWMLRNSIWSADYDDRAYDSRIPPQRYWQRRRYRLITGLIAGQGSVLDVGCGSSRIISALPEGSVALDILHRKLRYARKFNKPFVQGSGFGLPFKEDTFSCVLCSQVIEHVPKDGVFLKELRRVLTPGGLLVLGTPDYSHWEWVIIEKIYGFITPGGYADEHISHYTRAELVALFEGLGFTLEATRYILNGELIIALRKGQERSSDETALNPGE